ncbi:hypothetical protein GCM10010470_11870 [Saccharopolyspora taberi]|uniref:DAGKc domain-containing protein n=1 Tax=Saccharopolyspora taberi TaxID=60895 RepID=A0ABN3V8A3_9PSEU
MTVVSFPPGGGGNDLTGPLLWAVGVRGEAPEHQAEIIELRVTGNSVSVVGVRGSTCASSGTTALL